MKKVRITLEVEGCDEPLTREGEWDWMEERLETVIARLTIGMGEVMDGRQKERWWNS